MSVIVLLIFEKIRTVKTQLRTPAQSPVVQAAPPPLLPFKLLAPVPSSLKLQFVRPQTLPCQSALTVNSLTSPEASSNPPVPAPVPACVPIPGQIVCSQLLLILSGTVPSRFTGGPGLAGLGFGFAFLAKYGFVVYDKAVGIRFKKKMAVRRVDGLRSRRLSVVGRISNRIAKSFRKVMRCRDPRRKSVGLYTSIQWKGK